ncbi:MAG: hypothetical protein LBI49_14110 [Nocardiopsaceae bacterium]|nr:hypothetical protein [Nocardiopsaceae bacterium]
MSVVLLLAAAAVVAGAILVAAGRGGELADFPADVAPFGLAKVTAADIALLRPPKSLWGYHPGLTEEALAVIAHAVSERDAEIAQLRSQLAQLPPPAPGGEDTCDG